MAITAGAAVVAATTVSVVAAAFALFALLEGPFGPAGAAASVAVVFALLIALIALIAANRGKGGHHHDHGHDSGLTERLIDIVKEKPLVSAAAAVAAGVLAMRNPALVGVIVTAFMNNKNAANKK